MVHWHDYEMVPLKAQMLFMILLYCYQSWI